MPDTMPQTNDQFAGDVSAMPLPRQLATYTDAVAAIRDHADDLGVWLSIWSYREDNKPDAHARRHANDAVDAIDAAIRKLYGVRTQLITEIRDADDASAARVDALLAARRDATARQVS
jgi:hypothetical protein